MRLTITCALAALTLSACITRDMPPEMDPAEPMTMPPENIADQQGIDDTAIDEEELGEDEPDALVLDDTIDG